MDNQEHRGLLRHVVQFKFKDTVTSEQKTAAVERFTKLQDTIPEIAHFECGTSVSDDPVTGGFTHIFLMVFKSAKDRNTYLKHAGNSCNF